eukprot:CAMPEP_0175087052 /NCGR_PEP_ID=MMETSP0052_2-20121109/29610_1 /TAXON_ID=51329 ORGANISM="Polytomella parva, Strain SAG 63-3" /NCGR_SAMPLE_ID=MMETSP0052_2 /ASSEMBLY_ACC=CAM_ASM_000194 /LENGTH=136 /DNA_ID=CAMNT_0016359343 /DNA_START=344 /DNA_END=754 /DNA_ORIENTATION=-
MSQMHKRKQQRRRLDADPILLNAKTNPRGYQRALARTRQAAYVNKAVSFLKSGDPARAHMELTRALVENSTCRSPLLDGIHTREEITALYRLHLESSEVPPNFAVLLQLQELLGLPQEDAEKIESEVMQSPGSFSI